MKTIKFLTISFVCLTLLQYSSIAQQADTDSTHLPGADFSLEGALEMFKKANSPEEFEKLLNAEDNKVNNLDLNEDGTTDYIKVINRKENDVLIFVLQAVISETENQDIAVIELEKNGTGSALIQIVGDEDIYGEETIVEPSWEGSAASDAVSSTDNNPDYSFVHSATHGPNISMDLPGDGAGNFHSIGSVDAIIVNVWTWPSVRFVYAPGYRVWISPWSWNARPNWWRPWRPLSRAAYRPFHYQYRHRYVIVPTRRVARARVIYRPARVTSITVRTRNQVAVNHFRTTRTTRSVTVNKTYKQRHATRSNTTVHGRNGKVTHTKTTVKRKR
ncbi:hypothetical protein [Flavitalea sp.]|nr:hypothetical protein [Flavitalea sp.]